MNSFGLIHSKRVAAFLGLFLIVSGPAVAQITLTSSDADNIFKGLGGNGTSTDYTDTNTVELQPLVGQSGENQNWDFRSLVFLENPPPTPGTELIAYPGGAAMASSFPTATHVQVTPSGPGVTGYEFIRVDQNGMFVLGSSQDSMGTQSVTQTYDPALQQIAFPLSYQTQWTSSSSSSYSGIPVTITTTGLADGWGTLQVPGVANSEPALRVKLSVVVSVPLFGPIITNTSYQWMAKSGMAASINVDTANNATDGAYSIPKPTGGVSNAVSDPFSMQISTNPASLTTNLAFDLAKDGEVRVSLMDALGRQSSVLMNGAAHSGKNTLPIDAGHMANGSYFLRLESAGKSSIEKLVVSH